MSHAVLHRMTADEFLEWDLTAPDCRHELVDGVPVAMTGASQRHDTIVMNLTIGLGSKLRGGPCRLFSADVAIKIPGGQVRRPDVGVHCSAFDDGATASAEPRIVVEVLSPSTRSVDLFRKLEEYKTLPSLAHILLVDPTVPEAILWSRDPAGAWTHAVLTGLQSVVALPAIGISIVLADIYDGLTFRPAPRLISESGSP